MAVPVEMAGIEPATATLAGRARYLSCHPRSQASASFASACRFHGAHAMDVSIIQLHERLSGTINSGSKLKPPGGAFSWAAAGGCMLALTRQPLRRPGRPKAAAPDSCIRVLRRLARDHISMVNRCRKLGNCIFRGIPPWRSGRRVGGIRCGGARLFAWPTGAGVAGGLGRAWAGAVGVRVGWTGRGGAGIRD